VIANELPPRSLGSPPPWAFSRYWAGGLLVLLIGSWRLWWPAGSPDFPLVGWVTLPPRVAVGISVVSLSVLVAALIRIVVRPFDKRSNRAVWWAVAAALFVLFLVDQHRLQPWAYQSAIYACVFATMTAPQAKRWLTPLAAGVYVYSAAGKFDFQFAHTVGVDFLAALLSPIGGIPESWDDSTVSKLALLMPTGELLIGSGLLLAPVRRVAGLAAIAMHVTLIAILGPWSLDHSLGVLLWNGVLIGQAWFLFVDRRTTPMPMPHDDHSIVPAYVAKALVIVALVMPLLERRGYWDHWLSWSLYSPHTSRVDVEFHRTTLDQIPPSIGSHMAEDQDGDGWRRFETGAWSLQARGVPIYPQSRYQLALIERLCRRYGIDQGVRVVVKGTSDRWTGRREAVRLLGLDEIRRQTTVGRISDPPW